MDPLIVMLVISFLLTLFPVGYVLGWWMGIKMSQPRQPENERPKPFSKNPRHYRRARHLVQRKVRIGPDGTW